MKIEHLAVWTQDLEKMKTFYELYFGAKSNEKYINAKKKFQSYFLSFDDGPRLELMYKLEMAKKLTDWDHESFGLAHFAVSVGSEQRVDELTEKLRKDGYQIVGEARWTGDGYYESVVLDPENNRVEITV